MKHVKTLIATGLLALASLPAAAQSVGEAGDAAFKQAVGDVEQRLEEALRELGRVRDRIAEETLPLSRELSALEQDLQAKRDEFQDARRLLDNRTLDLTNLRQEIKSREDEVNYLANLLSEYVRNFETRLHIAEKQLYEEQLEAAMLAPENSNLSDREVSQVQAALVSLSIDRLDAAIGGTSFRGEAVDADGQVKAGTFVLVGPYAVFRSTDGTAVGTAEERLGSQEPTVIPFPDPADATAAATLVQRGGGAVPFDPTLGNAHKIAETEDTLVEHVQKGGPVMVPILGLAAVSLLVGLYKWAALSMIGTPSKKEVTRLLDAAGRHDQPAAVKEAEKLKGPVGEMLREGAAHLTEPKELMEEVMYERVLSTRLKLQRLLPLIAITAASAPLLGLLGTVTGIIGTFQLITLYGTGDAKSLSGGISEALITTKFGLIVAVPALLLYSFLNRKARGVIDAMERHAVELINAVGKGAPKAGPSPEPSDDKPDDAEKKDKPDDRGGAEPQRQAA